MTFLALVDHKFRQNTCKLCRLITALQTSRKWAENQIRFL